MKQRRRHERIREPGLVISIVFGAVMALGAGCSGSAEQPAQESTPAQTPGVTEGAGAEHAGAPEPAPQETATAAGAPEPAPQEAALPTISLPATSDA